MTDKSVKTILIIGLTVLITISLLVVGGFGGYILNKILQPDTDDNDNNNDDNNNNDTNTGGDDSLSPPDYNETDNTTDDNPVTKTYTCYLCELNQNDYVVVIKDDGWSCQEDDGILYTNTMSQCESLHPEYFDNNNDDNNNNNDDDDYNYKIYECYICEETRQEIVTLIRPQAWGCMEENGILYTNNEEECKVLHPEYYDTHNDDSPNDTPDDTPDDNPDNTTNDTPDDPIDVPSTDEPNYILLDGSNDYIEIDDANDFSLGVYGGTVVVWMRPDVLNFPTSHLEYIHWLGKGDAGRHEWALRMYDKETSRQERPNRISCYVWNPDGDLGAGSYAEYPRNSDVPIRTGNWYMITAKYDGVRTYMYINGKQTDSDLYSDYDIVPKNGDAPMMIGTRDTKSFFLGGIGQVAFYDEPLSSKEIAKIYELGINYNLLSSSGDYKSTNNLFAYYRMIDVDGSTVQDWSGNNHVGKIHR